MIVEPVARVLSALAVATEGISDLVIEAADLIMIEVLPCRVVVETADGGVIEIVVDAGVASAISNCVQTRCASLSAGARKAEKIIEALFGRMNIRIVADRSDCIAAEIGSGKGIAAAEAACRTEVGMVSRMERLATAKLSSSVTTISAVSAIASATEVAATIATAVIAPSAKSSSAVAAAVESATAVATSTESASSMKAAATTTKAPASMTATAAATSEGVGRGE